MSKYDKYWLKRVRESRRGKRIHRALVQCSSEYENGTGAELSEAKGESAQKAEGE